MSKYEESKANLVAVIVLLLIMIPYLAYAGWALSMLWEWFVYPLGGPAITFRQGAGIILVVSFLVSNPRIKTTADTSDLLASAIIGPIVSVGIGWLVKTFLL